MSRKKGGRLIAKFAAIAMAMSLVAPVVATPVTTANAAAVPKLSVTSKTIKNGKSFVLKLLKNGVTKIVSTKWSINDAGDDYAYLDPIKRYKVRVNGDDDDAGIARVRCVVTYKVGSVTRKKRLVCKVTVKKGTSTPTAAPVDPSQPTTQPVQTVIPVFDPASNTFTLKFNTAMTCSIAADNNNGDGTKEWISKSS